MIVLKFWLFCDWFYRKVNSLIEEALSATNLSIVEWAVLMLLYRKDGQNASELAKGVNLPPTSFTPLLDKLEAKKYIERRTDPSDRRGVKIYLTKGGLEINKVILRKNREIRRSIKSFLINNPRLEVTAIRLVSRIRR